MKTVMMTVMMMVAVVMMVVNDEDDDDDDDDDGDGDAYQVVVADGHVAEAVVEAVRVDRHRHQRPVLA